MCRLIGDFPKAVWVQIAVFVLSTSQAFAAAQTGGGSTTQPSGEFGWKDAALVITSALTVVVSVAALIISMRNTSAQIEASNCNARAQRWQDANQKEVERLETLLRTFHVPFLVRSEANNNMAQDLRDRLGDPNYRMLIKLFDPTWLSSLSMGNRALVDEVCATGLELQKFIEDHGGAVDSKLADHLSRAATHFRILSLAHAGKLGTDPKPFERYVYPRQLDSALEIDRNRILRRSALLRSAPSKNHGIIEPLELPEEARLEPWPNPVRPPIPDAPGARLASKR
jgi:hypothetical protein